jgi:hypothetical protein
MVFGTQQVDQLGGGYERNMSKKRKLEEEPNGQIG